MEDKIIEHQARVKWLGEQVAAASASGKKLKIYHGSTNSTRPQVIPGVERIDVSNLNSVIEVNQEQRYVLVEPNVPMDKLADALLPYHLITPIITEFPGITIGGAVMGGAGESSSFKFGCVSETSLEYEIILGDGTRIIASPTENADLFNWIASSCGSLGIITLLKIKLIEARSYVRLRYDKVDSFDQAISLIEEKMQSEADFVDGIMFSENFGVVMTGSFSDKVKLPNATFHKFSDEWFYLHVKKVVSKRDGFEELIPTRDYLFRYDRGAFWTARFAFHIHHFPFIRVFRVLFAWLFKTRTVLSFLHGSNMSQNYLVQDLCMPKDTVVNFMQFINKTYGVFPLWLCPLKANLKEPLSPTYNKSDLVVNVGVYGELKTNFQDFIDQNRLVQATVKSLGGRKVLYAHSYYKKAEFWDIYDKKGYEKLRQKYAAEQTFPDIFQKISVSKELIPSLLGGWKQLLRNWFTYKVR